MEGNSKEQATKQHYEEIDQRRKIKSYQLEPNHALSVPPLRLGLKRHAAATQRPFFEDF